MAAWLERQRWYASKSRQVTGASSSSEARRARADAPLWSSPSSRRGLPPARHELYQLPLASLGASDGWASAAAIAHRRRLDGGRRRRRPASWCASCCAAIDAERDDRDRRGRRLRFHRVELSGPLPLDDAAVRPMGVEQSNSSIVFGDETVLKVFRQLEPGINPELEVLRFLTAPRVPQHRPAAGLVRVRGPVARRPRSASRSGSCPGAVGGWELALDQIAHRLRPRS